MSADERRPPGLDEVELGGPGELDPAPPAEVHGGVAGSELSGAEPDRDTDGWELGDPDPGAPVTAPSSPPPRRRGILVAVVLALVVLAVAAYLYRSRPSAPPPPEPVAVRQQESPDPQPPTGAELDAPLPEVELPPLDASDSAVSELARALSAHPGFAAWLGGDELVRRFAATVANIADGKSPRPHLSFLVPDEPFRARRAGERWVVDPASYRRYDRAVEVFTSLDPERAAWLLRTVEPLAGEAYREIGEPGRTLRQALSTAIARLVAVPVPEGEIELVPRGGTGYAFADPRLEESSPIAKQLLRLGPANARRVQEHLRRLAQALDLES